jgi:AbrB family looped-hinge helix DNA binding protein
MVTTTRLSSKGQVIIPKDVRERHGWTAGTTFTVEERGGDVVLRPRPRPGAKSLKDLIGILKYDGPPKTIEEMDAGIETAIREEWGDRRRHQRDR